MTVQELVRRTSIHEVWQALGGGQLRAGRGRAFWRHGDGFNVSLNLERGVWHDHARGEGGGIIDLVAVALGCDRRSAAHWLGDYHGVPLQDESPSARQEALVQYRLKRDAELWRAALCRELARLKAEHLELSQTSADAEQRWASWWAYTRMARLLYLRERLEGGELLAAFLVEPESERQALVADERAHRDEAMRLAKAIVAAICGVAGVRDAAA